MDYRDLLQSAMDAARSALGRGKVAEYIPALAHADARAFGMAPATVNGEAQGVGDWRRPFSVQSISKLFTLALAFAQEGDKLWRRVGREPAGTPFNSLIQLEIERGIPRDLPAGDAAAYVRGKLRDLTPTYRAVATLHAPIEEVTSRLGGWYGDLEPVDEGRCHLHSRPDSLEWLAFRLAMLGCEFEVHDPPELAAFLRDLAARVGRAAGPTAEV